MTSIASLLVLTIFSIFSLELVYSDAIKTKIVHRSSPYFGSLTSRLGIPRGRRVISLGFRRPTGSDFNLPIFRDRPRFLVWNNENLKPWSKWSSCRSRSCRKIRFRQCHLRKKCPADFLVETKKCTEAPGCDPKSFVTTISDFNQTCGSRTNIQLRIIGGKEAKPHSWPWQGGLLIGSSNKKKSFPSCGATLIGDQWAITAAHCLAVSYWPEKLPLGRPFRPSLFSSSPLSVLLGDHHMGRKDNPEQAREVELVVVHKDFRLRPGSCHNDVALLKLKSPVELNAHVNIACLPSEKVRLPAGTQCTALGWGVVKTTQRRDSFLDWFRPPQMIRASVLQEVALPLVSHEQCSREYPTYTLTRDRHLCAGRIGKDTCKGDSGGPLMCAIKTAGDQERWFLYGITSFGSQFGCGRSYGVYTRVSQFTSWIKTTQKQLEEEEGRL